MAENSKIEWTHHTFNPWWGCAKVSPGCDHCYAERDAGRFTPDKTLWGVNAERREFGDKHWAEPLKWNAKAAKEGKRYRVFCASMADVFDKNAPAGARERLWELIRATPNLDWLLLTKRIGNAQRMLPGHFAEVWPNVWLGISVVNQEEADRDIPKLLALPARVRWLSMEPLLGPVDLTAEYLAAKCGGRYPFRNLPSEHRTKLIDLLDWVVVGGESGHQARPMHPDWAREVQAQCEAAGTPFLFKQWGEWAPRGPESMGYPIIDDVPRRRVSDTGGNGQDLAECSGNDVWMQRAGKKMTGRLLDGVQYDGYPQQEVA